MKTRFAILPALGISIPLPLRRGKAAHHTQHSNQCGREVVPSLIFIALSRLNEPSCKYSLVVSLSLKHATAILGICDVHHRRGTACEEVISLYPTFGERAGENHGSENDD